MYMAYNIFYVDAGNRSDLSPYHRGGRFWCESDTCGDFTVIFSSIKEVLGRRLFFASAG